MRKWIIVCFMVISLGIAEANQCQAVNLVDEIKRAYKLLFPSESDKAEQRSMRHNRIQQECSERCKDIISNDATFKREMRVRCRENCVERSINRR